MPAITVDDLTVLDRLREPGLGDQPRPVWQVTTAPTGFEGEGFPVRRAFAGIDLQQLDPFVMMDQMGEVEYAPGEPKGTPWHPHRGFETVTYIIDGVFDHQDSHGGGGTITNGDTQWMTAGSGLLHIEAPPEWLVQSGGLFHGIQLWVNLPRDAKMNDPKYQDIRSGEVALLTSTDARLPGPGHRRLGRRPRRPGLDVHADVAGARHHRAGCAPRPALGRRLQRARLRPQRRRHRRHRGPPDPDGPVRGAGRRRLRDRSRPNGSQESRSPADGRDRRRRSPDPRAARLGRPVRDEHQVRGAPGLRGLPARQLRAHPRA